MSRLAACTVTISSTPHHKTKRQATPGKTGGFRDGCDGPHTDRLFFFFFLSFLFFFSPSLLYFSVSLSRHAAESSKAQAGGNSGHHSKQRRSRPTATRASRSGLCRLTEDEQRSFFLGRGGRGGVSRQTYSCSRHDRPWHRQHSRHLGNPLR